jgi:hypothetical protein
MNAAAVDFALTRFEAVDGARLEVEGTWSGVRGVRFVRPALVVRSAEGAEKTLLADLEHKPWPAQEGETWIAAFPWSGSEPDVTRTELAVAPSIVVPLGGAAAADAPVDPGDALRARVQEAEERGRRLEAEVGFLRREREDRRDETSSERDRLAAAARAGSAAAKDRAAEVDELRAERDALQAARDEAAAARDAAVAERDMAVQERDALRRELREREQVAEGAARRREQALDERDAARRERAEAEALARRDGEREAASARAERDAARDALAAAEERATERERQRAAARLEEVEGALAAAETERDRALGEPAGVVAPPVRVTRAHDAESTHADWAARTAAILAVLVLLILAITFLRAIA